MFHLADESRLCAVLLPLCQAAKIWKDGVADDGENENGSSQSLLRE